MKTIWKINVIVLLALTVSGCKKSAPQPGQPESGTPAAAQPAAAQGGNNGDLVPIPLVLPKPQFVGTPENLSGVENLEKPLGKARPPFYAPAGTKNIALNKPVTASEEEPIMGALEMIVDGDKEASDGSVVELGPFEQWVQIDLEKTSDVYAIVVWHYHKTPRVYFDIIVQVSDDPDFVKDVATVFNNDMDNSLKLGAGTDPHYVETAEGRLVDAKGVRGRYVRLYSQANNQNDYSNYVEVEVFGQ
jgi:hypothetical protein